MGFHAASRHLQRVPLVDYSRQQRTNFALRTMMSNTTVPHVDSLNLNVIFGPLYWGMCKYLQEALLLTPLLLGFLLSLL